MQPGPGHNVQYICGGRSVFIPFRTENQPPGSNVPYVINSQPFNRLLANSQPTFQPTFPSRQSPFPSLQPAPPRPNLLPFPPASFAPSTIPSPLSLPTTPVSRTPSIYQPNLIISSPFQPNRILPPPFQLQPNRIPPPRAQFQPNRIPPRPPSLPTPPKRNINGSRRKPKANLAAKARDALRSHLQSLPSDPDASWKYEDIEGVYFGKFLNSNKEICISFEKSVYTEEGQKIEGVIIFTINMDGKKINIRKGYAVGGKVTFVASYFWDRFHREFKRSNVEWNHGIIKRDGKGTKYLLFKNSSNDAMDAIFIPIV